MANRLPSMNGLPSNVLDDEVRMRVFSEAGLGGQFDLLVSLGLIEGAYSLTKFGVNEAAPSGIKIDLWDVGAVYQYIDVAEQLSISSNNAGDTFLGSGARTVQVYGLDAGYNDVNEILELDGTDSVTTVNSYVRCFRMIIRSAGLNEGAIGVITAEAAGSIIQCRIVNGFNQSLMAIWTVPAGKTAIIQYTEASIGRGKEALFELKVRPQGEVFQTKKALKVFEKKSATRRVYGSPVSEKSDIKINVTADSQNAFVEGEFEVIVLDNEIFGL